MLEEIQQQSAIIEQQVISNERSLPGPVRDDRCRMTKTIVKATVLRVGYKQEHLFCGYCGSHENFLCTLEKCTKTHSVCPCVADLFNAFNFG